MSGYSPRRAPNVSQYIANLNTIPSAHDIATQQQESFNIEDDLAIFTNAEFFDFELGDSIDPSAGVDYNADAEERARRDNAAARRTSTSNASKGLGFEHGKHSSCLWPSVLFVHSIDDSPLVQTIHSMY